MHQMNVLRSEFGEKTTLHDVTYNFYVNDNISDVPTD
jgi:hypothetical protein